METRAARSFAGTAAARAVGEVPGLLGLVFERLPPGERTFTVTRLSHKLHAWARPHRKAPEDDSGYCM
jgi:hypothetical protein